MIGATIAHALPNPIVGLLRITGTLRHQSIRHRLVFLLRSPGERSFFVLAHVASDDVEAYLDEPEVAAGDHDEEGYGRVHADARLGHCEEADDLGAQQNLVARRALW